MAVASAASTGSTWAGGIVTNGPRTVTESGEPITGNHLEGVATIKVVANNSDERQSEGDFGIYNAIGFRGNPDAVPSNPLLLDDATYTFHQSRPRDSDLADEVQLKFKLNQNHPRRNVEGVIDGLRSVQGDDARAVMNLMQEMPASPDPTP